MGIHVMISGVDELLEGNLAGWDNGHRQLLQTSLTNYYRGDAYPLVNTIDNWSAEFDELPAAGGPYASMDALVVAAAAQHGVLALPPGGVEVRNDPETAPPEDGSQAWWDNNIDRCRQTHAAGEVVIGGHGYRKPWELDTFTVPAGTTLVFYVKDDAGLDERLAVELADAGTGGAQVVQHLAALDQTLTHQRGIAPDPIVGGLVFKRTYVPGEQCYNYTVTPPRPGDQQMAVCIEVNRRVKLGTLLRPNLGTLHVATCRLIDWYGGATAAQPGGGIHARPNGWRYVRRHEYTGYEGPAGQHPPHMQDVHF